MPSIDLINEELRDEHGTPKPGDILPVTTERMTYSLRIPETGAPTFRDFLDNISPMPTNSNPEEVIYLLDQFQDLMDEVLHTPMSVEGTPDFCKRPSNCTHPDCECEDCCGTRLLQAGDITTVESNQPPQIHIHTHNLYLEDG